jgi:hypothetical protein
VVPTLAKNARMGQPQVVVIPWSRRARVDQPPSGVTHGFLQSTGHYEEESQQRAEGKQQH